MGFISDFKPILDLPLWRMEGPALGASAAGNCLVNDHRNDEQRCPNIYNLRSATALDFYDPEKGGWIALASPTLGGTFGAGSGAVFVPSHGPRGTIAAGGTVNSVTLSTALPATVGVNQLANNGSTKGFFVRIIDSVAGGSGKMEVRRVLANTAGTAPTIYFDQPLSFTPGTGATYEFLSGRIYLLSAGTTAAGVFKYYDVLTNSYSGNLATTNLPATLGTDCLFVSFSELHVPYNRKSGEGFVNGGTTYDNAKYNAIQATAATGTTITGSGMPALFADEYKNFQVHIVEDTVNPTAVGQRRKISAHTAGATAAFTVAAWAVTPSTSAKFVIENDDDKLMLRNSANSTIYCYNSIGNTWDTTTYAAAPASTAAGTFGFQTFGIARDTLGYIRHSQVVCFRGGGSINQDIYDVATNTWSTAVAYANSGQTFTTATCACYANAVKEGKYLHINVNGTQNFVRYNLITRTLDASTPIRYLQGTVLVGGKMATSLAIDGADKLMFIYHEINTSNVFLSRLIPE